MNPKFGKFKVQFWIVNIGTGQQARNSLQGKNLGEENSSQGKGCFLRKEKFENLQV